MEKNKDKEQFEEFIEHKNPNNLGEENIDDEIDDFEPLNEKELPFTLLDDGSIVFKYGFNYGDCIVEDSKMLFETPLLKPYISKFVRGKNKNITIKVPTIYSPIYQ